jgi:hypothetical protein
MATIKKITGNYTILASDKGKHLIVDSPNDVTIVVPATSAAIESEILIRRWGQGRVFLQVIALQILEVQEMNGKFQMYIQQLY